MLSSRRLLLIAAFAAACAGNNSATDDNNDPIDNDLDGYFVNSSDPAQRDCADGDPSTYPGATEICDGRDNNCDGEVDNRAEGAVEWFPDDDGDGFGVRSPEGEEVFACRAPEGYAANRLDCNDRDSRVFPAAPERCNGLDDDCDAVVDNGLDLSAEWFLDRDRDGFGGGPSVGSGCSLDPAWVRNDDDCNDLRAVVNPDAAEICDGFDNDCDNLVDGRDDNIVGAATYYGDLDGDGFGNVLDRQVACSLPVGYVTNLDDCNDDDPEQNPNTRWFNDNDLDGHGNPGDAWPDQNCWQPIGYVRNTDDCNDNDPLVYNGVAWYPDADRDGFGGPQPVAFGCVGRPGWTVVTGDCNDRDDEIKPGATEVCDSVDNNCNGSVDAFDPEIVGTPPWYRDADNDGYGLLNSPFPGASCTRPPGYSAVPGDCDDSRAILTPVTEWWADADRDGYGNPAAPYGTSCVVVPGHAVNDDDCDDTDEAQNPGTEWYRDADMDGIGYGTTIVATGCQADPTLSLISGDCDDTDPQDVRGTCIGPQLGLVELVMTVDSDSGQQTVRLECVGQPAVEQVLRAADRNTTVTISAEIPADATCRIRIFGPNNDPSGDGAVEVNVALCGTDTLTFPGVVNQTSTSGTFLIPSCSGCTDPVATNYDPTVLIPTAGCLYGP